MKEGLKFKDWNDFFKKIPFTFYRTALIQKKYIETINDFTPDNGSILEIAGGSGYTTVVVADFVRIKNATVTFTDLEPSLTEQVSKTFSSIPNMKFQPADSFELPFKDQSYDIIFHQGMLEHFEDIDIILLLKEQGRVAKKIVFDIPNDRRWNKTQEFGNERFLSRKHWGSLVQKAGLKVYYETARRFSNPWKQWIPVAIQNSNWFHKYFGESSIIVCGR